jgi:formylglycine-generating enzyme required for sulfatase activity
MFSWFLCSSQRVFPMPDYVFDKQPVEIEGMVWFPSDKKPYSENSSQDSFQVITMTWNQYLYWDTLFAKHNNTTYLPFGSETKVPLRAEYKRVAEPFFIKVHEVTNQEYLEFLHDITPNEVDFLSELGYPENLDMNFLPDTSRWVQDFGLSYNQPLMSSYFRHPKYKEYPVVCVNYYQALGYCHWVTKKLNEIHHVPGFKLKAELPSQLEWDRVVKAANEQVPTLENHHFIPNLLICDKNDLMKNNLYRSMLPTLSDMNISTYMDDGYIYPAPVNEALDKTGEVINLNANVSEWMAEDFQTHWAPVAEARQDWLLATGQKSDSILADIESWFNESADSDGQLVRGANWVHESQLTYKGQRLADMASFTFVSPNKSHSTLGFRYVIRLVSLEE